jgi:acyl carrier protein
MNKQSIENKVIQVVADTFAVSKSKINNKTHKNDLQKWDSLGHLMLIMNLEEVFSIRFSLMETQKMDSIKEIIDTIDQKCI